MASGDLYRLVPAVSTTAPYCLRDIDSIFVFSRYLIWIGSDQEKTFGPTISGLIYRHIEPERMCLWDSKARGKCLLTPRILTA